jgi:hypothetical protein
MALNLRSTKYLSAGIPACNLSEKGNNITKSYDV